MTSKNKQVVTKTWHWISVVFHSDQPIFLGPPSVCPAWASWPCRRGACVSLWSWVHADAHLRHSERQSIWEAPAHELLHPGAVPCCRLQDRTASLELAAKRIVWGSFLNTGQTCVRPDYVLVHKDIADRFVEAVKRRIDEFYGTDPMKTDWFGRSVSLHEPSRGMCKKLRILAWTACQKWWSAAPGWW